MKKQKRCCFFLDEVNYDFNYSPNLTNEETKINNELLNV